MFRHWLKILIAFILIGIIYAGCSTDGILRTESFFREQNPDLPLTPKVCYMLGTSAFRSFRYKLAIDIINRNLKQFPYEKAAVNAEYRRAMAYEKLGNYDGAIKRYEDFMFNHPKDKRLESVHSKINKLKALHQADQL